MAIATVSVILISTVLTVYYLFTRFYPFNYWRSRKVPYLKPSFPLGNLKGVGKDHHISQVIRKAYTQFRGTAPFCGVYYWTRPVAIITDLDLIRDILVKDFSNFTDRGTYYNLKDDPLSANLFTADGDDWRNLRKKFTPAFSSGKMKHMFPTIVKMGERLRDAFSESISKNGNIVEIKSLMIRYTCDIIGTCAFGIECNSLQDPNGEFFKMAWSATNPHCHGPLIFLLKASFKNLARFLKMKLLRDDVSDFFMNITLETVKQRQEHNISRNDFMDILLKMKSQEAIDAKDATTLDEIASSVFLFFFAAFETSSSTLTFLLHELVRNVDVQTKCREEVRAAYEKHGGQFTYEMLSDLPYLDQVIHETLRIYPQATSVNRIALNDYAVPGTDLIIEKGTWVKIPVIAIQNDPKLHPNPEVFDPDRFGKDQIKSRHPFSTLMFGEGPRACIGIRFGLMQMKVGLVMMLSNFEFSICSETVQSIPIDFKHPQMSPNVNVHLKVNPIK